MNTLEPKRYVLGLLGLVIGLPYFVFMLFALAFTNRHFGKMVLLLPVGCCFSLAGYALIRKDRYLQYFALGLSVAMAGGGGVLYMQSPAFDDSFFNLLIPAAYSIACAIVGRDRKAPQHTSVGDLLKSPPEK
jgi:hypothetical protein